MFLWRERRTPDVVGLPLTQAEALAAEAGMKVEVTAEIPSFDTDADTVLEQAPDPGIESEDGILRLTVTREPTPVTVTEMKDYDPEGDQTENPDSSPTSPTARRAPRWSTELYRSAAFGNLKDGVGLAFTLDEPATIIEIVSAVEGWEGELLQDISSGSEASIAKLEGKSTQIITLREPLSSGRIWFTKLTEITDGRYGVELSEIRFFR